MLRVSYLDLLRRNNDRSPAHYLDYREVTSLSARIGKVHERAFDVFTWFCKYD
ncbi:MAG TPA: hypothetical protein VF447_14045 [Terriglobales bacterium]